MGDSDHRLALEAWESGSKSQKSAVEKELTPDTVTKPLEMKNKPLEKNEITSFKKCLANQLNCSVSSANQSRCQHIWYKITQKIYFIFFGSSK